MITAIEAIHRHQLTDAGNGQFFCYYPAGQTSTVLSCNPPDGRFTLTTNRDNYERCVVSGSSLVFAPAYGGPHVAYIVPFVESIPNG